MIRSWIGLFSFVLVCSCSLSKQIKDGRTAYQQKQYAVAVEMLTDELKGYSEGEEYAELSYLLGESYKNLNDSDNALKWFIEAAKNNYGPEAYWEMAYALKKKERYEDAILSFQRLLNMTNGRENDIRKEIEKCKTARKWSDLSGDHQFVLEALRINSTESDYAPFLLDPEHIVFTSDRRDAIDGESYPWTGNSYSDLFILDLNSLVIEPFSDDINTSANEGTACFTKDGSTIFFTQCHSEVGDSYCKVMTAQLTNGRWSKPVLAFSQKPNVNYGDPVLIENDSVLIYTSNDPVGIGAHDLYYSLLEADGSWSEPDLMPPYLNTIGDERFPRWMDNTLYYSSDFLPGLGGLDIFKTSLNPDGSWTQPENILAPINSSEDDYAYVEIPVEALAPDVKKQVYFTSTRGVFGNDDLYSLTEYKSVDELKESDTPEVVEEVSQEPETKLLFLQIRVREKMFAVPTNPNSYVVGMKNVQDASIRFTTPDRQDIFQSKEDGTILLPIDTGVVYKILVGKSGYLNNGVEYKINQPYKDLADGEVLNLDIEIEKIFNGVEIVMDDIYYDFNQATIREDAKSALDFLVKILKDNPAIKIQLSAHTDCRGDDDYNLDLSQRRAASAVAYIMSTGNVSADMMIPVGYGESAPEIICEDCDACSEEEHQINRRTSFTVIE